MGGRAFRNSSVRRVCPNPPWTVVTIGPPSSEIVCGRVIRRFGQVAAGSPGALPVEARGMFAAGYPSEAGPHRWKRATNLCSVRCPSAVDRKYGSGEVVGVWAGE